MTDKEKIKVLIDALEWYADDGCYMLKVVPDCGEDSCCSRFEPSSIQDDNGEVAKRALAKVWEPKGKASIYDAG